MNLAYLSVENIARDLGISSPTTIWSAVTNAKPTATAMAETADSGTCIRASRGLISCDTAGSPSHPSASEARVIPSWQADRYALTLFATLSAALAPLLPSYSAICSCDLRTLTRANSATTKNAFISRKNTTRIKLSATDTKKPPLVHGDINKSLCN